MMETTWPRFLKGVFVFWGSILFTVGLFLVLSYRLDFYSYFRRRSFVYGPHATTRHLVSWWVHRIAAMLWAFFVIGQLWIVWTWGQMRSPRMHRCIGLVVVLCDCVNVISGLVMLAEQPFQNMFSVAFVSVNVGFNSILIFLFVLSRFNVRGMIKYHGQLGTCFLTSVFGAIWQFSLFAIFICKGSVEQVEQKWNASLLMALFLSALSTWIAWWGFSKTRLSKSSRDSQMEALAWDDTAAK